MSNYLPTVISRLYRPPADRRQVFALSRADACRVPPIPSVAVISITAAEKGPAQLQEFNSLLRLSFADVDFLSKDLSARAKAKVNGAFTPEQAQEIIDFIDQLPEYVRSVVIHCEGGYSRSCAVAQFLREAHGYAADTDRLTLANPSVYQTLTTVHKRRR